MAHCQPLRLGHVGRRKEIDIGAGFDFFAHQAGRPEFRPRDRIWARRKSMKQIGKGARETPRAHYMQHVCPRRGRQAQNDEDRCKAVAHGAVRSRCTPANIAKQCGTASFCLVSLEVPHRLPHNVDRPRNSLRAASVHLDNCFWLDSDAGRACPKQVRSLGYTGRQRSNPAACLAPQLAPSPTLPRKREREYRAAGPQKSGLFACGMGSTS